MKRIAPERPRQTAVSILAAVSDENLFGRHFKATSTWKAWRAFLTCLFGLPIDDATRRIILQCTGRKKLPKNAFTEAWLVSGRRGGKSFTRAVSAVFLACFRSWVKYLA